MATRTITYSRVVHLSHVLAPDIPHWPGDPPLEITTVAERAVDGYAVRRVTIGEHSGTHVNAPISFCAGGAAMHEISAEALIAAALVLDVRRQSAADSDYLAQPADVAIWERAHGRVPAGSAVLLLTGWAARWGAPAAFFNAGADGRMHFPGFSPALAELLIGDRQVAGIGIDTHGVDGGLDREFTVNRRVLAAGGLVIENLANLESLPPFGATLVIGALRWRDGCGSPAALLALVP